MRHRRPRGNHDDPNLALQDCLVENWLVSKFRGQWSLTFTGRRRAEELGF